MPITPRSVAVAEPRVAASPARGALLSPSPPRLPTSSPLPMFVVDLAAATICQANEAAADVFGHAAEDLPGRALRELFVDALPEHDRRWRSVAVRRRQGTPLSAEVATVHADDDYAMVLLRPTPRRLASTLVPPAPATGRTGGATVPPSPADPGALVDTVLECIGTIARRKGVEVVGHVACGEVRVWRGAWIAALYELALNAVQASRRGDSVVVEVIELGGGESLWQVRDAGAGMSAETLAELGRPSHGGGIGLVRSVVDVHHGLLRVETDVEAGTTASIYLPNGEAA